MIAVTRYLTQSNLLTVNKVFICISAVGWVWIYLLLPETKGVPLEEMADKFGDKEEVMVHLAALHEDASLQEGVLGEIRAKELAFSECEDVHHSK